MIEVREYVDARGRFPYGDWVVKLDAGTRARIITAVLRVERGNFSAAKSVGSGVSELRLDFGPGIECISAAWGAVGDPASRRHEETTADGYRRRTYALG
jgi:putative component of toxin-antitoxin plasmid stabilization module